MLSPTYGEVSMQTIASIITQKTAQAEPGEFELVIGTDSQNYDKTKIVVISLTGYPCGCGRERPQSTGHPPGCWLDCFLRLPGGGKAGLLRGLFHRQQVQQIAKNWKQEAI